MRTRTKRVPFNTWATLQDCDKTSIDILISNGFTKHDILDRYFKNDINIFRSYRVESKKLESAWIIAKASPDGLCMGHTKKYGKMSDLIEDNKYILNG